MTGNISLGILVTNYERTRHTFRTDMADVAVYSPAVKLVSQRREEKTMQRNGQLLME